MIEKKNYHNQILKA